jgi:probable rRNA maturation factor
MSLPPKDEIPLLFHARSSVRRTPLRQFLAELTRRITRGRSISCVITGDTELRRLNKRFLGKNYATDVLSFSSGGEDNFAGDLAISIDRAKAQAREHGHSLATELRILMLHGALHLSGMDHESDAGQMAKSEARWRNKFELPLGLIERTNLVGKTARTKRPARAERKTI